MIRRALLTAAVAGAALLPATAAGATGRRVTAADNPPSQLAAIRAAGVTCRADSRTFRVWWGERGGAPGALAEADGSCATVPPVVDATLIASEQLRTAAIAAGFPALTGDAAPAYPRQAAVYRALIRLSPSGRAASLRRASPAIRGRLLAGFLAAERTRVYRGLPGALVRRLRADTTRALTGRPRDFVGGSRRLDIVLDGTGASGVQERNPGRHRCVQGRRGARYLFVSSSILLYVPSPALPRATLAHELFHGVQCIMGVGRAANLLQEGTAEWFASQVEPGEFAGTVSPSPSGGLIASGRATGAIAFCNDFDPGRPGQDPYRSFAIWSALELARPGTVRSLLRRAAVTPATSVPQVVRLAGDARWSEALASAVREVCGTLRTPSQRTVYAPELRTFFGGPFAPFARPGQPAVAVLPPGGVLSVAFGWSTPTGAVVDISAPGVTPQTLATRTSVHHAGAGIAPTPGATGVQATLAGSAASGAVTVANPSNAAATQVAVTITPLP